MDSYAIKVKNLAKNFGKVSALNGIDLNVPMGKVYGMLGPNAAGKSTTIRLLAGIIRGQATTAKILGIDLETGSEKIKRHIGYVAQHFALYPDLTAAENLTFYATLYGKNDAGHKRSLLIQYGLADFANRRAGSLSGGYKRRLSIACAMVHEPELILLDEPTAGIDPVTRNELWELFYELSVAGKTLFITTHYMEEAERCHYLAFLNRGNLVAEGSLQDIRSTLKNNKVFVCSLSYDPKVSKAVTALEGVLTVNQVGEHLRVVARDQSVATELKQAIIKTTSSTPLVQLAKPTIEDVFITLTKE
ncbi:MAG TPA: ABC transporter ATP-binding protein [Nitrospinota bacterium]|jgi:ABC-type multidrug transport system ATPase subunit|nr:ABC transporter ATP-binding protein [Nitrospinota bacterium]|tara:strand:+ start:2885 stop:3796 length:912 start_codon:yes stop_codon:yes gene_type:complete